MIKNGIVGMTLVAGFVSFSGTMASGIRSGSKTSAKSEVHSEACPETVTSGGHSTISVEPGDFGFLCFKMELFNDRGEIVSTGLPYRPGGMASAAVSEAMSGAAAKCESKKLLLNNLDKQIKASFTCSRTFPSGWSMGGNLVGALKKHNGEINDEELREDDAQSGVGPLTVRLVSTYSCSAKVEAYCE